MTTEYAQRAVDAAETLDPKTSSHLTMGGIRAITYALLEVADAIRSHGR
ncbi:MAG TPA: hypothetical protein VGX28_04200 [Frankiaceae bacterium]|jgi:hypothetical protein|nr:hypothetical protein [Frankiaceae bacterium]